MNVKDSVALVTGANRGVGEAFVRALLERGAAKIYAGMREHRRLRGAGRPGQAARARRD